MGIEALARHLAGEETWDLIYSERWMGWPDPDDDEQMAEDVQSRLPRARERAQRYKELLDEED